MDELRERALRVLLDIAESTTTDEQDRIIAASWVINGTADNKEAVDAIADGVVERLREVS